VGMHFGKPVVPLFPVFLCGALWVFVVNFDFRVSNFELRPSVTTSDA